MQLKTASLPEKVLHIIRDKGTEAPYTGEYVNENKKGTYLCRQCGIALFRDYAKFNACGWPSFDEAIKNNIHFQPDHDGIRTEIVCSRCRAHLGHVFYQEGFTVKNTRFCVNSLSIDFVNNETVSDTKEAIVAGGCFWGIQYYFDQLPEVLKTEVGYIGGKVTSPRYDEVKKGESGHYEAVRIIYDVAKITYEDIIKYFFEIHDPGQIDGQGPDIGSQYLSAIFYYQPAENEIALKIMTELEQNGFVVKTKLLPMQIFWCAENFHQHYYEQTKKSPYCHHYVKKFK